MMKKRIVSILWLLFFICSLQNVAAQTSTIVYQYWIDNDIENAVTSIADNEALNLHISIADLHEGVHFYNARIQDENGVWGTVVRKLFAVPTPKVPSNTSQLQKYEYWIDNDYANRVTISATGDEYAPSQNIDVSNLSPGIHFYNARIQDENGVWGTVSRQLFCIPMLNQQRPKQITGYRYIVDSEVTEVLLQNPVDEYELDDMIDVSKVVTPSVIDDSFHFEFTDSVTTLMRSTNFSFSISFCDQSDTWSAPFIQNFNLVDTLSELTLGMAVPGVVTLPVRLTGGFNAVKLSIPTTSTYVLKSAGNCNLCLYLPDGTLLDDCDSTVLKTGFSHEFVEGTYYAVIYGNQDEVMLTAKEDLPEPYAVLSENNTVLTFYYDDQKSARGGMSVGPFTYDYTQANMPRWSKDFTISDKLTTVIFDDSFASYKSLKSTAYWFHELRNLKTIIGIENVCTDSVTDMRNMFYFCSSLINLDLSSFKTDNVTNMGGMFMFCEKLASLNVSSFNTGNVVDMQSMFNGIIATSLDLSGFNTEKVTDMSEMFAACRGLEHLDLSNFNTSNVTNFNRMFWSSYNLKSLDLSLFTTGSVTDCRYMFSECSSLKTIYIGENWIFPSDFWYGFDMFADCANLVGGAGTVYDANHVDYTYARIDGGPSNPGYFTDKNAQADDGLELYAIDVESEMKSNETFMPTQSVKMTLGNDSEWSTNNDLAPELGGELKFDANIYYPGIYNKNYAFVSSVVGTNNPAAGPLVDGMSTGSSYKPRWRNLPESGAYFIFESEQDGSLIVPIRINPNKPLYVTDDAGVPLIAYQLKDQDGVTVALDANSSTAEKTIAFLSLNVSKNQKYYIFCKGSKPRVGGYIFAPYTIDIDPATTAAALDSLLAEPVDATFDSNGVLSAGGGTTMADALEYVGGRAEVAKTITAIVWNSTATLTNDDLQGLDNPNMLIYVKDAALAPANRDNVVIGDFAKNIVLTDVESGNNNFYCPQAFTAEMISYTHEYRQQTEIGVARGWETIALPFTVQTIMHEKWGGIVPFGNSNSGANFWLRQMTSNGLQRATKIEANVPYIISMPNNETYDAPNNLAGRVTFSSQDALVPMTEYTSVHMAVENGMLMFVPCFQTTQAHDMIYALNVGETRGNHPEGSVFEANYRDVRPFEAFTVHEGGNKPAPQFILVFDLNQAGFTGIENVRSHMCDGRSDVWYNLNGRRLQQKPTQKGVYLNNRCKVIIR